MSQIALLNEKFQKVLDAFRTYKEDFPELFKNDKELANLTGSWFLGAKFENEDILLKGLQLAIENNHEFRNMYHPEDPEYVTHAIKQSPEYKDDIADFFEEFRKFNSALKVSTPFYSYRSLGHMNWEISIPAMLGYFSAMLFNQNNVALEASPATTAMERSVASDLCQMLGYETEFENTKKTTSWGHITCDGSIANIESVWASRNLKFYPLAFFELIKAHPKLFPAKDLEVKVGNTNKIFSQLHAWELLNLDDSIALSLPEEILKCCPKVSNETLNEWLKPYLVQEIGLLAFYQKYLKNTEIPVVIGPASAHYSWPKACALVGLGAENFKHIALDNFARMQLEALDAELKNCLDNKIPVLQVVAVIGTTEEGAVDPLASILQLKEKYATLGLNFHLHADAAWGGYFASTLQGDKIENPALDGYVPNLSLSSYTQTQFKALQFANTITIDPHKAGYVPYPAGALCYKDSRLKNLISFIPSYIDHGTNEPSMGLFGIEGSKPGAAPASVFLSHKVMPPHVNGIGKVLGESLFSAKYFYAQLVAFEHPQFICIPIVEAAKNSSDFIREHILGKNNREISSNTKAIDWLMQNGQDTTIVSYFFNFRNADGTINSSLDKMNLLNNKMYELLSIPPGSTMHDVQKNPLFITSSEFDVDIYGLPFIHNQMKKARVEVEDSPLTFLISTIMSPWVTATADGNYLDVLLGEFIKALEQAFKQINK